MEDLLKVADSIRQRRMLVLVIGLIAVLIIGPDRLPQLAAQFARLIRSLRDMANGAKERMREEMGPDYDDVDWQKLDPRQYDPRRIIREALLEDEAPPTRPGAVGAWLSRFIRHATMLSFA